MPHSKEDILNTIQDIMVDTFELEREKIIPEAHLYHDLDIDSIDAVDLIVKLKHATGRKPDAERFKQVRTIQDVVDAVYELVHGQAD